MRFTGLRPIERGGLRGFGFSIQFTDCREGNGLPAPVLSATEKQRACGNGPDPFETPADVLPQQVDRAGEVIFLPASPATPLNPRPMISRGSSLTDVQTASAGDAAASLSYSGA